TGPDDPAGRALFAPGAPLFRERLVRMGDGGGDGLPAPLIERPLKLDDRIVEYLLGHDVLDARLEGMAVLETGGPPLDALPLAPDTRRALWHLAALWRGPEAPPAFFWGPPGSGKGTAATALARALDRPLLTL